MRTFLSSAARAGALGLFLTAALAAAAGAYVGQWHSYTDKSRVNALIAYNGRVYAGTQGGIRRIDPATSAEADFDNLDGLLDVWITAFVEDGTGALWAVARDGYLYRLKGDRWEVSGRSYAAQQWKMNDRAALGAGPNLFLGSQKGLTLFSTSLKLSQMNLTRFRDETDVSVLSLLRRSDTLYVGTSRGVFKAGVYFSDPLNPPETSGYANLADPSAWTQVRSDTAYHLAFIGDSLAVYGPGTLIQEPIRVEAFPGRPLVVGAQTYPAAWNGFRAAVIAGGRVFAGGDSGLAVSQNPAGSAPDAVMRAPLRPYPRDTIFNLGANGGRIWGHSPLGAHTFNAAAEGFTASPVSIAPFAEPELNTRNLRNVRVDGNGDVYFGMWGLGLTRLRNGDLQRWTQGTDTCIFQAFPPDNHWTVVFALSNPRNGGLFFSVFRTEGQGDHQLVYFNTRTSTISCPTEGLSVTGGYPHAVHAFSDTLLGVLTDRGLSLFKIREGLEAPSLESKGLWTVNGGTTEGWDMATDQWGRPWMLTGGTLTSLDLDSLDVSTTHYLDPIDNFTGDDCKSLEADAAGLLWVGCANGLFQVRTGIGGDLENVRRYGLDDGLLGLGIYDVSVDPVTGKVWVATDRGVSMLESGSQPAPPGNSLPAVTPYPNPFRPQHRYVIFDNLPRNATLRLHNAGGTVVRIFHPADRNTGNQIQWDGKNEQGKPVAPGVYLFSIVSGSAVQRGKIIVAR